MSDITDQADPDATGSLSSVLPALRRSPTLELLQQLVDVGATVPVRVASRAGLSTSELHALRHLMGRSRGPVELARLLGVTSAASSGVVDRLVSHGHVERRPHPEDGRRTEVVITDHGRREVLAMLAPMFAALAALDADLDDAARAVIDPFLRGATEAMRPLL